MQLNRKHLKNIRQLTIALFFCSFLFAQSQNIKNNRIKVDGVSAVIGDYVILESDISLSNKQSLTSAKEKGNC